MTLSGSTATNVRISYTIPSSGTPSVRITSSSDFAQITAGSTVTVTVSYSNAAQLSLYTMKVTDSSWTEKERRTVSGSGTANFYLRLDNPGRYHIKAVATGTCTGGTIPLTLRIYAGSSGSLYDERQITLSLCSSCPFDESIVTVTCTGTYTGAHTAKKTTLMHNAALGEHSRVITSPLLMQQR